MWGFNFRSSETTNPQKFSKPRFIPSGRLLSINFFEKLYSIELKLSQNHLKQNPTIDVIIGIFHFLIITRHIRSINKSLQHYTISFTRMCEWIISKLLMHDIILT